MVTGPPAPVPLPRSGPAVRKSAQDPPLCPDRGQRIDVALLFVEGFDQTPEARIRFVENGLQASPLALEIREVFAAYPGSRLGEITIALPDVSGHRRPRATACVDPEGVRPLVPR